MLAPFLPFFAECLYTSIQHEKEPLKLPEEDLESVHECLFSSIEKEEIVSQEDKNLVEEMDIAKCGILLGRSLRSEAKIPLRQPLQKITVAGLKERELELLFEQKKLLLQELNIKEITTLTDPYTLVEETVKPNLPSIGPKAGKKMKEIMKVLSTWERKEIQDFEKKKMVIIDGIELLPEDILIERKAKKGKCAGALEGMVMELDTSLTEALLREGLEREIINRIQQKRKTMKLELIDRIHISWTAEGTCREILRAEEKKPSAISQEVLATSWQEKSPSHFSKEERVEIKQQNKSMSLALSITAAK